MRQQSYHLLASGVSQIIVASTKKAGHRHYTEPRPLELPLRQLCR